MDWHPLIVHYPIALWAVSAAVDLAAWVRRRADWHGLAYFLQVLAAVGALAAVLTGNSAARAYREDPAVAVLVQRHEDWATLTLFYFLAVVLGRLPRQLRGQAGRRAGLWVLAVWLGVGGVWLTAHYGGALVYEQGVGVRRSEEVAVPLNN